MFSYLKVTNKFSNFLMQFLKNSYIFLFKGYKQIIWNTREPQEGVKRFDKLGAGYFLSNAIKMCPKLRHVELRNIHLLSKAFLTKILDAETLRKIGKVKRYMNPNSMYVIAMAYKCKNLESLIIEDLKGVCEVRLIFYFHTLKKYNF